MLVRHLLLGLVMTSATAFAGSGNPLDAAKAKCKALIDNGQMKPQTVQLVCDETSTYWKALDANERSVSNFRTIAGSVAIEKLGLVLGHQSFTLPGADTNFNCQQLVKMERHIGPVQETVSCSEIESITDLGTYCGDILANRATLDPALATEKRTKEIQDFCPALAKAPVKDESKLPYPLCMANNGQGFGEHWLQDGMKLAKDSADLSENSLCIVR